jgi:membrane protein
VAIVGEDAARQYVTRQVSAVLPAGSGQVESIVQSTVAGFGPPALISIGFLLVTGTRVFAALARALNTFWSHVDDASWIRRQLSRLLLLLAVGGIFSAAVGLQVAAAVIGEDVQLPPVVGWVIRSQVIPNLLIFIGLYAIYILLPHNAASWRTAAIGALVGTLLLRVAQAVFTLFISTVGNFQSAYGPLATLAILMTWALIGSGVVLLAAELVAVIDRRRIPGRKRRESREERSRHAPGGTPST